MGGLVGCITNIGALGLGGWETEVSRGAGDCMLGLGTGLGTVCLAPPEQQLARRPPCSPLLVHDLRHGSSQE